MPFRIERKIHFPETDAAGIVFFANYLKFCHEAYEDALDLAGIGLMDFFSATGNIVPVTSSNAEYRRPLRMGDRIAIQVTPERTGPDSYAVHYELFKLGTVEKLAAKVRIDHICLDGKSWERQALPPKLAAWVDAKGA